MPLADIISRIESDAGAEARVILDEAQARARKLEADAAERAQRESDRVLGGATRSAASEAATARAAARLAGRDRLLTARRELVDRALAELEAALGALPAERYVSLIAATVAAQARVGDVVRVAEADSELLSGLEVAVASAGGPAGLSYSGEPAGVPRGVLLVGDGTRAEVSPASIISARREELETRVAGLLTEAGGK
jgi:vacuolar-type H+-ATPase subunit E/Vma4